MNTHNSRFEIQNTKSTDKRRWCKYIGRRDQYYWRKDDVILWSSGKTDEREVFLVRNGIRTQDRKYYTVSEKEDQRKEGYTCK